MPYQCFPSLSDLIGFLFSFEGTNHRRPSLVVGSDLLVFPISQWISVPGTGGPRRPQGDDDEDKPWWRLRRNVFWERPWTSLRVQGLSHPLNPGFRWTSTVSCTYRPCRPCLSPSCDTTVLTTMTTKRYWVFWTRRRPLYDVLGSRGVVKNTDDDFLSVIIVGVGGGGF